MRICSANDSRCGVGELGELLHGRQLVVCAIICEVSMGLLGSWLRSCATRRFMKASLSRSPLVLLVEVAGRLRRAGGAERRVIGVVIGASVLVGWPGLDEDVEVEARSSRDGRAWSGW